MATNMFLKLPGIDGESRRDGREDWIELLSYQLGVSQAATIGGAGSTRNASRPEPTDFNFSHEYDKASPVLFQKCAQGAVIPTAVFEFVQSSEGAELVILKIDFGNLRISSVEDSSGGERPTESVNLAYESIHFTYTEQKSDGSAGDKTEGGWDFNSNTPA